VIETPVEQSATVEESSPIKEKPSEDPATLNPTISRKSNPYAESPKKDETSEELF
jgi:hypothetical protein